VFLNFYIAEKSRSRSIKIFIYLILCFLVDLGFFFKVKNWFIEIFRVFIRCFYMKIGF